MQGVLQAQKDALAAKEAEELQKAGLQVLGAEVQAQHAAQHAAPGFSPQYGYQQYPQMGYPQGSPLGAGGFSAPY